MTPLRTAIITLAAWALHAPAWTEVRTLLPTQQLEPPNDPNYEFGHVFGRDVAVDGGAIIVLADHASGRSALLYRRESSGQWTLRRALITVTDFSGRSEVRMKNGIAAVQFGNRVWIFEYINGNYVLGQTAAPIRHPGGLAISGNSILIGGDDCGYDAVVYQKGSDGIWRITGRLDDNQGECRPEGLAVELHYDHALLHVPNTHQVTAWRRNGTALDWIPTGSLDIPIEPAVSDKPVALQGSTAVTPATPYVFRRSGTRWTRRGIVIPVDYPNVYGTAADVTYRDGVLLALEAARGFGPQARPYVYLENTPGEFEHVAILNTAGSPTREQDVSGRTVIVATEMGGPRLVTVYELPSPLMAPEPIVNDFEERDLSDFTFSGGAFALARRGSDDVLARTDTTGLAIALLDDSEWPDQQRIEAHITPSFGNSSGWVGLVTRYVDPDNYYYVAIRPNGTFGLHRRLGGVDTLLMENPTFSPLPSRVSLVADGTRLSVIINDFEAGAASDSALRRGRAGLATLHTRADFDDVHAAATPEPVTLMETNYPRWGNDYARPYTEIGGTWRVIHDPGTGTNIGMAQLDASGSALAINGVPVRNQEIVAIARFDSFGPSIQGAWFGLLARFVDPRTHYYVTVRSTNLIQIRKQVNGVITVLGSALFTAVPGRDYHLRFSVINDQLQLFVDGVLVASAHDDEIASGEYGVGTYRATALWRSIIVRQP